MPDSKTLIGGTGYKIKGGKTLIGGTAKDIKEGKTLIDGTAKTINFNEIMIINGGTITPTPTVIWLYATTIPSLMWVHQSPYGIMEPLPIGKAKNEDTILFPGPNSKNGETLASYAFIGPLNLKDTPIVTFSIKSVGVKFPDFEIIDVTKTSSFSIGYLPSIPTNYEPTTSPTGDTHRFDRIPNTYTRYTMTFSSSVPTSGYLVLSAPIVTCSAAVNYLTLSSK